MSAIRKYALLLTGLLALLPLAAAAQEGVEIDPAAPATAATQPAPAPDTPAIEPTTAEMLEPELLAILSKLWGPAGRQDPQVTDAGNVTVLSVPEGCAVYLASVAEIEAAGSAGGPVGPAVEDVVFNSERYLGRTPLTVAVAPGDHVLAVRAMTRLDGFDGGCVRKTTTDVITGGQRYAYHLYPLRKHATHYQCFVASFIPREATAAEIGEDLARRGTFRFPEAQLAAALSASTHAPPAEVERLAGRLNQLGIAFYKNNGVDYLVKLTLVGSQPELMEWAVE